MKYETFKSLIESELQKNPEGMIWSELREKLSLPYKTPCPTWVRQLEEDTELIRTKGKGRALIWKI
jgi:hypothetical protein